MGITRGVSSFVVWMQVLYYSTQVFAAAGVKNGDIATVVVVAMLVVFTLITVRWCTLPLWYMFVLGPFLSSTLSPSFPPPLFPSSSSFLLPLLSPPLPPTPPPPSPPPPGVSNRRGRSQNTNALWSGRNDCLLHTLHQHVLLPGTNTMIVSCDSHVIVM